MKYSKEATCCGHRAIDHEEAARSKGAGAGRRCTIPGCKCPGWILPPKRTAARQARALKGTT